MRAVIAGEKDDRVLVDFQLLELVQNLADVSVEPGDHGRFVFFLLWPVLFRVGCVAGHFHAFVF